MADTHLSQPKDTFQYSFGENFSSFKKELKDSMTSPTNIQNTKDPNSKAMLADMLGVTTQNKELKLSIQQMETKLQSKEHEISRLKHQLETKGSGNGSISLDMKPVLTQRCANRSPASGEHNEGRISKNFRANDLKKDRSFNDEENKSLYKEIEKLKGKLRETEDENRSLKKELNKAYEKSVGRLSAVEDERKELSKHNDSLRHEISKLSEELSVVSEEKYGIRKRYEDLKSCYDTLETLTSNKFSDYSMDSIPHSEPYRSMKGTPGSNRANGLHSKRNGEDSFSSVTLSSELSLADCRKLLGEIMEIYNIKKPGQIISCIHKTEKVIQAIPRLRKLIADVSAIVIPKGDRAKDVDQIDLIIPSIKKCYKDLEELDAMKGLRHKLIDMLEIGQECTNFDIVSDLVKKVDNLICAQYTDFKSQRSSRDFSSDRMLFECFNKIFGLKADINTFKQMHSQLEDLRHFSNLIKQKSGINLSLKSETCLKYILKMIENSKRDREAADIAFRVQKTLNCKLEAVNSKVEEYKQ